MFTLSEKIKVLNTDAASVTSANKLVKALDASASNAIMANVSDVVVADKLVVDGFGNFPISKIVDIKVEKAIAAANDTKEFRLEDDGGSYVNITAADLTAGVALEVIVTINTGRYQAEVLTQDKIGSGRTIKFSTLQLGAKDDDSLVDAIVAGWGKYKELFHIGYPVIEITDGTASTDFKISTTTGYESVIIEKVEIKKVMQGIAKQRPHALTEQTTASTTAGTEGKGQGKFLEESVRMATSCNNEAYGVDTTDTRVDIRGNYTAVSFSVQATYDEKLSIVAADAPVGTAIHKFVLYLNEATCMAAEGAIDLFANIAVAVAGATDNTATALALPLTIAEETSEVLFINDGSTVATAANFMSNTTAGQS